MRAQHLLIVGGYGRVGSLVARELSRTGHVLTLAGRDPQRGARLAHELGCALVQLDVERPEGWDAALDLVDGVLVCIDQTDPAFARRVLERGLDYVDVTASDRFFRALEQLDPLARRAGAAAVLSVGLAPGLTNLLVRACADQLERATEARIALKLGLGDVHGRAAIAWMLDQLATATGAQRLEQVRFTPEEPPSLAGPLDFADQHVVRRTLGLHSATTLLTVESTRWTRLIFAARPILRWAALRRWLSAATGGWPLRLGTDLCALRVEVHGLRAGRATTVHAGFVGRSETRVTAQVAAAVIRALPRVRRAGVHHIEQLLTVSDVREDVDAGGDTRWSFGHTSTGGGLDDAQETESSGWLRPVLDAGSHHGLQRRGAH